MLRISDPDCMHTYSETRITFLMLSNLLDDQSSLEPATITEINLLVF